MHALCTVQQIEDDGAGIVEARTPEKAAVPYRVFADWLPVLDKAIEKGFYLNLL